MTNKLKKWEEVLMMKRVPDEKWEESFDSALIMAWLGGKNILDPWTLNSGLIDTLVFFYLDNKIKVTKIKYEKWLIKS